MTKGEKLEQRYVNTPREGFGDIMRRWGLDMEMDKEGATMKKREGSKFLDKRSTQVGGASS
jgi:hypothetical protein